MQFDSLNCFTKQHFFKIRIKLSYRSISYVNSRFMSCRLCNFSIWRISFRRVNFSLLILWNILSNRLKPSLQNKKKGLKDPPMNHQSLVVWRQVKNFYLSIFSLIVNVKIAQLFFADIYVLSSVFFIIRAHSIECHKTKTEESERLTRKNHKKPLNMSLMIFQIGPRQLAWGSS